MNTYRNKQDDRTLIVVRSGAFGINPDDGSAVVFAPRPEDRYSIAADILGDVAQPADVRTAEEIAGESGWGDKDLEGMAATYLKALIVRKERVEAAKAAEARAADLAKFDAESRTLWEARWSDNVPSGEWSSLPPQTQEGWRNVARVARQIHAPNGDPEVAR